MDSNLARRIGVAAVAIPATLAIVWVGGLPLALVVGLVGVLGVRELFDLATRQGIRPATVIGYATAALLAPLCWATVVAPPVRSVVLGTWPYAAALWLLLLLAWALAARNPAERPLAAVAVTALGVAYAAALPAFIVAIRHGVFPTRSWAGTWLVFFPLVVVWICDTAAMFGGRAIGGPKLAPTISPGKTRAGSAAGVVGALAVAPIFGLAVFPRVGLAVPLWQLAAIAGVLSVVGQVGDLAESLFKREVGVKDSSHLIPGHGGVLDRFDSLYFAMPVAAAMYRLFGIA